MRAFIAIEAADDVRSALEEAQEQLTDSRIKVKWVARENIHLTLKFLGEIDDDQTALLRDELKEVAGRHAPFRLEIAGIALKGGRVVAADCSGDLVPVKELAVEVETCAEAVAVPREDRDFWAHFTIGRKKGKGNLRVPDELRKKPFGVQEVKSFVLMRSELTPEGPNYTPVEKFALG